MQDIKSSSTFTWKIVAERKLSGEACTISIKGFAADAVDGAECKYCLDVKVLSSELGKFGEIARACAISSELVEFGEIVHACDSFVTPTRTVTQFRPQDGKRLTITVRAMTMYAHVKAFDLMKDLLGDVAIGQICRRDAPNPGFVTICIDESGAGGYLIQFTIGQCIDMFRGLAQA